MKILFLALILLTAAVSAAVEPPQTCTHCGMDREKFANSRVLITYNDGTTVGTCSINCAATDLATDGTKKVTSIAVGDYVTQKLIDATSASWVLGGDVAGVMTKTAKWAFARKEDALAFIKEHGGNLATFDEVLSLADTEKMGGGGGKGKMQGKRGRGGARCCSSGDNQ